MVEEQLLVELNDRLRCELIAEREGHPVNQGQPANPSFVSLVHNVALPQHTVSTSMTRDMAMTRNMTRNTTRNMLRIYDT